MKIYYCGKEDCAPGHFFGPAVRPHYLIHFVSEGKGIYKTQTDSYQVKAGEAFLICPEEVTYYQADEEKPWSYAWIAFGGEGAKEILEQHHFSETCLVSKIVKMERTFSFLKDMIALFENFSYDEKELLGYFYLIISGMERDSGSEVKNYDKGYMERAIDYIHHNYSYNISISDVARHVGIDRTYLFRIFKQYKEISPKQYLINYRIMVAKDMLQNTKYNVTEVALSSGFHDSSSFCKSFQKAEGMTPLQYRRWGGMDYGGQT